MDRPIGEPPPCESPTTQEITVKEASLFDQQKPSDPLTRERAIGARRRSGPPEKMAPARALKRGQRDRKRPVAQRPRSGPGRLNLPLVPFAQHRPPGWPPDRF